MSPTRQIVRRASIYSGSGVFLGAMGAIALIWEYGFSVWNAVVLLALYSTLVILWVVLRQVRQVHVLVNGQRHELIERIDQLTALLQDSHVGVPPSNSSAP